MPEKVWAAQRVNAGNRPDTLRNTHAEDIHNTPKFQAARRIADRFFLPFATAATIAELAQIGGAR